VIPPKQLILSALIFGFCTALPAHAVSGSRDKAAAKAGAVLFQNKGCAHCHGEAGIGGKKGPPLTDLGKNKLWTPTRITNQIMNGGQKMPAFFESLTDEEVTELVAYLRARHKPAAPPAPPAQ
jgi:mono/diheme cytochrome c family protein